MVTHAIDLVDITWPAMAQECEPESQFIVTVENGDLIFIASMPGITPTATYTWTWTDTNSDGDSGTGTTYSIPVPPLPTTVTMTLNVNNGIIDYTCTHLVYVRLLCEAAGFTVETNKCSAQFNPTQASGISHTWIFDDGSPDSHDVFPTHLYSQFGTYNVCHVRVTQSSYGDLFVNYCCQDVTVSCGSGGNPPGFTTMLMGDCCRLKVCFQSNTQDPEATHTWDFGGCYPISEEANPCHYYDNISTYPEPMGTPTVEVEHCVTIAGNTQCTTLVVNLVSTSHPEAIYVGTPGVSTPLTVVSCLDGQALFPGSSLQGPYIQNPLTQLEVHVAGELAINKSYSFEDFIIFCMDPCASMRALHHRQLTFSNYVLVDNKDYCPMWYGLELDYKSQLTTSMQVNIESSIYGIRTNGESSVLRISDTHFIDNWVGMTLTRPFSLARFDRNIFDNVAILDPAFPPNLGCWEGLPEGAPFIQLQSFAGIVADGVTLNIPNMVNPPQGVIGESIFRNMANGIVMRNTNASIQRCRFLDIATNNYGQNSGNGIRFRYVTGSHSLQQRGIGLSNLPTFDDCTTGIRVFSDNAINTLAQCRENLMVDMFNGIHFDNISGNLATNSIVEDNNITASNRGVWVELNVPEFYISHLSIQDNQVTADGGDQTVGILLQDATPFGFIPIQDVDVIDNIVNLVEGRSGIEAMNFRGALVSGNEVNVQDVTNSPAPPFPPIGIYLNAGRQNTVNCHNTVTGEYPGSNAAQHGIITDFSTDNSITDNSFENTRLGIQFRNPCGTQTLLRCNTMEAHEIGIDYWPAAVTGHQGPNGASRGNRWLGTWPAYPTSIGARHQGPTSSVILQSEFYARVGTNQYPPSIEPSSGWFSNGPSFFCAPPACDTYQPPPTDSLTPGDTIIANTGGLLPADKAALNREIRRYLYGKLAENPTLSSSNTLMQGFQTNLGSVTEGRLYIAGTQTNDLFLLDTGTMQSLEDNFAAIQLALEEIAVFDSLWALDTTLVVPDSLLDLRQAWEDTVAIRRQSNASIRAQWLSDRSSGAPSVISYNSGITTDSLYDENEQALQHIYLSTVAQGLPVTLAHKVKILDIAQQCPEVGGLSTYWARTWHGVLTGELVVADSCEGVEERSREITQQSINLIERLRIIPNPAQNSIAVEYALPSDWHDSKLILLDAMGRTLNEYPIDRAHSYRDISVESLPSGIYFLQIRSGRKKTASEKLVILK